MAEYELAIRARRAVTPAGVRPVTVAVRDGRIAAVAGFSDSPDAAELEELPGREVLLPGLVDTHVHVNEPGRTEWEGFATRDQGGRRGRSHHADRHAAQLPAAHDHARARCASSRPPPAGRLG